MSLEDNKVSQDDTNQSWWEKYLYWSWDKSLFTQIKKDYNELDWWNPVKIVGGAAEAVWTWYDAMFWDKEEKKEARNDISNFFGGVSEVGKVFDDKHNIDLNQEEEESLKTIRGYNEDLSMNVFWTVWLKDQWPEYKFWNKEELEKELAALDESQIEYEFTEEEKVKVREIDAKIDKETNKIVNEKIKEEIKDNDLANTPLSIEKRKQELYKEYREWIEKTYSSDILDAQEGYYNKIKELRNTIAEKYIKAEEWKTAYETYSNNYSRNTSVRTEQFIRKKYINDEIDNIWKEMDHNLYVNYDKEVIGKMVAEYWDKLTRDYKHLFETMLVTEDKKEQAKIKWLLMPQLKARQKLFKNQILAYTKLKHDQEEDKWTDWNDDLENKAFKESYNKLTEDEKNALLRRDWTDTVMQMYHDSKEFRKRFHQATESLNEWDYAKSLWYSALMVWNWFQMAFSGLWWIVWSLVSWWASATFKRDDESKIYYDEYELTSAADGIAQKWFKHIMYNPDDLLEVFGTLSAWKKVTWIQKGLDKFWELVQKMKKEGVVKWTIKPKLTYTTKEWLKLWKMEAINFTKYGITEWAIINPTIDRMLRTADTDYNALFNLATDSLEPVIMFSGKWIKGVWEGLWVWETLAWAKAFLKTNNLSQSVYWTITWETTIWQAVDNLMKTEWMSRSEAYKNIKDVSNLVYATTDMKANRVYKDDPELLANATLKYIDQLKNNAKVWADKMLTDEWNVIQLEDITKYKKDSDNVIDNIYEKINSWDEFTKTLWEAELKKYIDNIPKLIKWQISLLEWRLKLDKKDLDAELKRFEWMINKLDWRKDWAVLKQIYNNIYDLMNSSKNKRWVQIITKVNLYDYVWMKKYSIKMEDLEKLQIKDPQAYQDFKEGKTLKVSEWAAEILWINKWIYWTQWDIDKSLFKQLREKNEVLFDKIMNWLSEGKGEKKWYNFWIPQWMNKEEFERGLKEIFWEDSIVDIKWTRTKIAEKMAKEDKDIVIGHNIYKWNDVYYIWVWSKIEDKWFLVRTDEWYKAYHEDSSEIISTILQYSSIEEWIINSLPINKIWESHTLSDKYMDNFVNQQMVEIKQDEEFWKKIDWKYVLTDKWNILKDFIKQNFRKIEWEVDDGVSKYIFDLYAVRIIDNHELFKEVLTDLNKIKKWEWDPDIIKTMGDYNTLMKSFVWERQLKNASKKFRKEFYLDNYRKEASKNYDTTIKVLNTRIKEYRDQVSTLEAQRVLGWSTKIVDDSIKDLNNEIERLTRLTQLDKKEYIDAYANYIYRDAFTRIAKKQFHYSVWPFETKSASWKDKWDVLKNNTEIKEKTKQIEKKKKELKETPKWLKEFYRKEIVDLKKKLKEVNESDAFTIQWKDKYARIQELEEEIKWIEKDIRELWVKQTEVKKHKWFQWYEWNFENKGKWTKEWDWKDKAMRLVTNWFIWEVSPNKIDNSSSWTSYKHFEISDKEINLTKDKNRKTSTVASWINKETWSVMLARNWIYKGKELSDETKKQIDIQFKKWKSFVVWDMPDVDSQFIDHLDSIWAKYKIYHTWDTPRIKKDIEEWVKQDVEWIEKYNKLKKEISELEKDLNRLDSIIDKEKKVFKENLSIQGSRTISEVEKKEFYKRLDTIAWYTDTYNIKTALDDIRKYKHIFDESDELFDKFIDTIVWKWTWVKWLEYSRDTIKMIRTESHRENLLDSITWARDFDEAIKENPIVKMFSRALTWAKSLESETWDIVFNNLKKHYEEKTFEKTNYETLEELYAWWSAASEEFRKDIAELIPKQEDEAKHNYWWYKTRVINEHKRNISKLEELMWIGLKDINLKLTTDWKVIEEDWVKYLLGKNSNYTKQFIKTELLKKFRALNQISIWKVRTLKKYTKTIEGTYWEYDKIFINNAKVSWDSIWGHTILSKQLKDKDDNFDVIHIWGMESLWKLVVWLDYSWVPKTLSQVINEINFKKRLKWKQVDWKEVLDYESDSDNLSYILRAINNEEEIPWISNKILRSSLWLKDNEYVMWTYWDKESYLQVYKADTFAEAKQKYFDLYIEEWWFILWDYVYNINDIAKRESALASVESVFGNFKVPTKTFILEEVTKHTDDEIKFLWDILDKDNITDKDLEDLFTIVRRLDPHFSKNKYLNVWDNKDIVSQIELAYFNDLHDGTSFMWNDLAKIHDIITTGTTKDKWIAKDKAKKVHATWVVDGQRYLWKSLYNRWHITSDKTWVHTIQNAVGIWENSLKLRKWMKFSKESWIEGIKWFRKPKADERVLYIDWREYKVKWIIEDTSTLDMMNAKADTFKTKKEYWLSRQIISQFPIGLQWKILNIMKWEIDELVSKTLKWLWDFDESVSVFGDEWELVKEFYNLYKAWWATDVVINGKLKALYSWIQKIIDKYTVDSANVTIKESMLDVVDKQWRLRHNLKENEIIASKDSKIIKSAKDKLEKEKKKLLELGSDISKEDKERLDFIMHQLNNNEFYVTAYRNPVPNLENLWVFKVIFAEDVWLNTKKDTYVKKWDVILHPENTYIKLKWDNDWDTIVTLPIWDELSTVVARSALWFKDTSDDLNWILKRKDEKWANTFENTIAAVSEIDSIPSAKIDPKKLDSYTDKDKEAFVDDLIKARDKNIMAKTTVALVSSHGKVLNIFKWIIDALESDIPEEAKKRIRNMKIKGSYFNTKKNRLDQKEMSIWEVLRVTQELNNGKPIKYSKLYSWKNASAQTLVLDYAKADVDEFPKYSWWEWLMEAIWLTEPRAKKFFFHNVVWPLAMSLRQPIKKINSSKIKELRDDIDDELKQTLWYQRHLLGYVNDKYLKKKELSNWLYEDSLLFKLKQNIKWRYIVNISWDLIEELDWLIWNKTFSDTFWRIENSTINYVESKHTDQLEKSFDDLREVNEDYAKIMNDVDNKLDDLEVEWIKFPEKEIIKDFLSEKRSDKDRRFIWLYLLSKNKNNLYSLLDDTEKVDYLNYSVFKKGWIILEQNNEFSINVLLNKTYKEPEKLKTDIKENIQWLEAKRKEVTDKLKELNTLANNLWDDWSLNINKLVVDKLKDKKEELEAKKIELEKKKVDRRDAVKKLLEDSNKIVLDEDWNFYTNTETWQVFRRVTSMTWRNYPTSSSLWEAARSIWIRTDNIIRDFFNWELKDISEYNVAEPKVLQQFIKDLEGIKKKLDARWEKIYANNIKVYNEKLWIAWELDLLSIDKTWKVRIYDMTTRRFDKDKKIDWKQNEKFLKDKFKWQLNMYRLLLNNTYWLKADELRVLPVSVWYHKDDLMTSTLDVRPWIDIDRVDNLKKHLIDTYNKQINEYENRVLQEIKEEKAMFNIHNIEAKTPIESEESMFNIHDIAKTTKTERTNIKEEVVQDLSEANESLKSIEKLLDDNNKFLEAFEETKAKYKDIKIEKDKTTKDYVKNIDIVYEINWEEKKALSYEIQKANDIHEILNRAVGFKLSDHLLKYDPESLFVMNRARDLFWTQAKIIKAALWKEWDRVRSELKKQWLGINDIDTEIIELDTHVYKHIKYDKDGYVFNKETYKEDIKQLYTHKWKEYLNDTNKNTLLSSLDVLSKQFEDITVWLNKLNDFYKDTWWYKIEPSYKWFNTQFVKDVLWLFTWDLQFEFRRRWIIKNHHESDTKWVRRQKDWQRQFIKYMKEKAEAKWIPPKQIKEKRLRQIYNYIYKRDESMLLRIIKNLQWAYYHTAYQSTSVMLWWLWHVNALTQIIWNTLEVNAVNKMNPLDAEESNKLIDYFKLYWEDTVAQWQWQEYWMQDTKVWKFQAGISELLKWATEKTMQKYWSTYKVTQLKMWNIVDSFISEPLLAVDMLNDWARRIAAMWTVMRSLWFKNAGDMIKYAKESTRNKDTISALFYDKYNEIWGWVISTSPIYRETIFTVWESTAAQIFQSMFRLLNWWWLHKAATAGNKVMWLWQAVHLTMKWDIEWAKILYKEFYDYATVNMINLWLAAAFAARIEKYDHSWEEEKVNIDQLTKELLNNYTAIDILIWRELDNWKLSEWYDAPTRAWVTTLWLLKHMTRFLKANGGSQALWAYKAMIQDVWWFETSTFMKYFYQALQNSIQWYTRKIQWMIEWNIMDEMYWDNNLSLLGLWIPTRLEQVQLDKSKVNKIVQQKHQWAFAVWNVLMDHIEPTYMNNEVIRNTYEKLKNDKALHKITEWWIGLNWYNIRDLMLDEWKLDWVEVNELYKQLITYNKVWYEFDEKGRKVQSWWKKYDQKMDDIITSMLNDMWYTKESFITDKNRNESLWKLMVIADQMWYPDIKWKHLPSFIADQMLYKAKTEYAKSIWTQYKNLNESDIMPLKAKVLDQMSREWLLNLNKENFWIVLDRHLQKNHWDIIDNLNKMWSSKQFQDYMKWMLISTHNLKDWDTNSRFLNSWFSSMFKWYASLYNYDVWGTGKTKLDKLDKEILAKQAIKAYRLIRNSNQPEKEKTAKLAAMLYGMNEATHDLLKDNNEFNNLTRESKRMLTSMLYQTNSDLIAMDWDSVYNSFNKSWYKKKSYSSYFNKWSKSGYWSWPRPWFSKQFPEIWKMLQWKEVPRAYKEILNNFAKPTWVIQYTNFPAIREVRLWIARELFRDLMAPAESKIKIKTKKTKAKAWYVKTKKPVRQKLKRISKPKGKQPKYTRRTTIKGLPWDITVKAF